MAIPTERKSRDQAAYIENSQDSGVDRRTNDQIAHTKLDEIKVLLGDSDPNGELINVVGFTGTITASVQVNILLYTVPVDKEFYLQLIDTGGTNIARYNIQKGPNVIARARTSHGAGLTKEFKFVIGKELGLKFVAGETIGIYVQHERPVSGTFEARMIGILKDA